MTLVDMNTVLFYQPPKVVGQCKNGRPAISSLCVPMACGKSDIPPALESSMKWSGIFQNCDLIEIVDIDGPPLKKPFNPI